MIARVTDERPAGAVGLAEEVRQVAGAGEALDALRATDALGEVRRGVEQREMRDLDVLVIVLEERVGDAGDDEREAVVGGKRPIRGAGG